MLWQRIWSSSSTCLKKLSEAKFKGIGVIYLGKENLKQHDTQSAVLLLIIFTHVYNKKGHVWQGKTQNV